MVLAVSNVLYITISLAVIIIACFETVTQYTSMHFSNIERFNQCYGAKSCQSVPRVRYAMCDHLYKAGAKILLGMVSYSMVQRQNVVKKAL